MFAQEILKCSWDVEGIIDTQEGHDRQEDLGDREDWHIRNATRLDCPVKHARLIT